MEICPICRTRMKPRGKLRLGKRHGLKSVYACPKCKYRSLR